MGGLFDGISIGLSGLNAAQASLNTTQNNIANANTPGYSRQTVDLEESFPALDIPGTRGRGVSIGAVTSSRNVLIERRLRTSGALSSYYKSASDLLNRIETLFNEPAGTGLSSSLNGFFNSWQALSTNPSSASARSNVARSAQTLSTGFKQIDDQLSDMLKQTDDEVSQNSDKANLLIKNIAFVNGEIANAELGGIDRANGLRDRRGEMLKQLSEILPIETFETSYKSSGQSELSVQTGGMSIISGKEFHQLKALKSGQRDNLFFINSGGSPTDITDSVKNALSGSMSALFTMRDTISQYRSKLDEIAKGIVNQVNLLHTKGMGLTGYSSLASTNRINAADSVFSATSLGLPIDITKGSFDVVIADQNGNHTTSTIKIEDGTTFENVKDALSNVNGITAYIDGDNHLVVQADAGSKVFLTNDNTGFLASVGMGTFFTGSSAADIKLNPLIINDPSKIAAGLTNNAGDGQNAASIGGLAAARVLKNGTTSIMELYNSLVGDVGIDGQNYKSLQDNQQSLTNQIEKERESESGVSLNEEAAKLIKFQKAFNASAKFITVIDNLTTTIIGMIR